MSDEWPDGDDARWVEQRSRVPLLVGAFALAYAGVAVASWLHPVSRGLALFVFFLASFVVYAAFTRMVWLRRPRALRASVVAGLVYLGIGLVAAAVAGSGLAPRAAAILSTGDPAHWLVAVAAWPSMWLWANGCALPVLACPG